MSYELSAEEKNTIIENQLRSISYRKYASEIELVAEEAVETPPQNRITELNKEIKRCADQLAALAAEQEKLGL